MSVIRIPNQRAVIDRRALADAIAALVAEAGRGEARARRWSSCCATRSRDGRAEIARRLAEKPSAGHEVAEAQAFLIDQLIRVIHDHVIDRRLSAPATARPASG